MSAPTVGLYSISVRGLDVCDLLAWANTEKIPFVHLRGGPRGFDLIRRDAGTLLHWRQTAEATVPITGVTADIELADLLTEDRPTQAGAREAAVRLAEAAAMVGAGWLRLLARTPPTSSQLRAMQGSALLEAAVPLLAEIHHPLWLAPSPFAALGGLLGRSPQLGLLADTAQLGAALVECGEIARPALIQAVARAEVLHLSDNGGGFDAPGQTPVAALAALRIAAGHPIEVAMEWTGAERTPAACLARYRAVAAWWSRVYEHAGGAA